MGCKIWERTWCNREISRAQEWHYGITNRRGLSLLWKLGWDGVSRCHKLSSFTELQQVRSWRIKDCTNFNVYDGHQAGSQIKALSVSDDRVATGSTDKTCRVFDKNSAECIVVISLDVGVCGVLLFETSVFVGTKDSKGYKYCAKSGKLELTLAEPESTFMELGAEHPSSGFKELCMSSTKGGCIAAANRSAAHLWDVKTGEVIHTLYEADNVDVNSICLCVAAAEVEPGRSFAFTGLDDNTAHMYCINEPVLPPAGSTVVANPTPDKPTNGQPDQPQSSCCVVS